MSIIEQTQRFIHFAALHFEAAHDINALRNKTEMTHHGNLAIDNGTHHLDSFATALEFRRSCSSLQKSASISYGLLNADVEAKKGHIGDEQGTRFAAYGGFEVMVHHRNTYWRRVFESKADVTPAVTDETDIDGRIRDRRRNRVVGSRHD
jgi:hypothetical protein